MVVTDVAIADVVTKGSILVAAAFLNLRGHRIIDSLWPASQHGIDYPGAPGQDSGELLTVALPSLDPSRVLEDQERGGGEMLDEQRRRDRNTMLTEACYFTDIVSFYELVAVSILSSFGTLDLVGVGFGVIGTLAVLFGRTYLEPGSASKYYLRPPSRGVSRAQQHFIILLVLSSGPVVRVLLQLLGLTEFLRISILR